MRTCVGWLTLGLAVLVASPPAGAYFLDKDHRFDVRLRAYSQLSVLTNNNEIDSPPFSVGTLAAHRNFYNPELDAKLIDYTRWMGDVPLWSLLAPDDFKFHFAWWGFYDGVYDYMDPVWNDQRKALQGRFSQTDTVRRESYTFNDENKNPRHIYASRNRINELYLDWTKGRVFFRVGRQAISWGESDTIALLDVSNPFDLTLGAPAFFQDIEESRIPLWTVRSTINVLSSWRFLSNVFADVYLVPGPIDTTNSISPIIAGVSPYSPPVLDPQVYVTQQGGGALVHTTTVDKLPRNQWSQSRWGARLTGLLFNEYTVQGWFFRTYPTQPIPLLTPGTITNAGVPTTIIDDRGFRVDGCFDASGNQIRNTLGTSGRTRAGRPCGARKPVVTELFHRLESVVGVAATWFSQPLNGIIRTEAEYLLNEDAFIPHLNVAAATQVPGSNVVNRVPKANFLRGLLGYDAFFFFRPLNPTRSFLFSTTYNISWNTSERRGRDYRYPNPKPGKSPVGPGGTTVPDTNFEDLYQFEQFFQTVLQTDYMHGRLAPRLVFITDISGIFGFAPDVTYRATDNFLFSLLYRGIESSSRRSGLATFRDRDQVQFRVTFQLN